MSHAYILVPWYRLVCICFPTPGRGLPYGSGLVLSRCLGPGECLHSFIHSYALRPSAIVCTWALLLLLLLMLHLDWFERLRGAVHILVQAAPTPAMVP